MPRLTSSSSLKAASGTNGAGSRPRTRNDIACTFVVRDTTYLPRTGPIDPELAKSRRPGAGMEFATKGGPVSKRDAPVSKFLVFTLALIAVTISQALSAPATMRGADRSDTCLRAGLDQLANSSGALLCVSSTDFRNASFRGTDLSGTNLAHANMDGADVTDAAMLTTSFYGTDLTRVKGLSQKQLDQACGDPATKVPRNMSVHI